MKTWEDNKNVLDLVEIRARRKMAEVRNLVPNITDSMTALELSRVIVEQLRQQPLEQRQLFSTKLAVAVSDMQELRDTLSQHLRDVADSLQKLRGHGGASAAYGRWQGDASPITRSH
jgi:hypothetical protein